MDVEIAQKKTKIKDEETQYQQPSEHQPLPNFLVMLIMIATASGVCVYMYHVTSLIQRLEQRVDMISYRLHGSTTVRLTATPRSTVDLRQNTGTTSTTPTPSTTTSSASTSTPMIDKVLDKDWGKLSNDIDEEYEYEYEYYDYQQVGSGLPYDDEDAEESSGSGSPRVSYNRRRSYELLLDRSYNQLYKGGRSKRSVQHPPSDTVAPRHRRQHQQQRQGQNAGRRRSNHRATSERESPTSDTAESTGGHPQRASRDERRRDRKRSERRRQRTSSDVLAGQMIGGLKVAHFFAPRGPSKHYVSGSVPPATFPFWKAENWTASQNDWFSLSDNRGVLTILQPGLYMIYAQLVYHDLSGRWSFGVYVGDDERVKCINTEQIDADRHHQASSSHGVYQHCYTSTVLQLSRFDAVSIRCLYGSRSVVMQPEFTFWGLIQLTSTNVH